MDNIISTNILFRNNESGIWLFNNNHKNIVKNNTIYDNSFAGIFLLTSNENDITQNIVYDNVMGIVLSSSNYNVLSNNSARGIHLDTNSNFNEIHQNTLELNLGNGLYIENSENNIIFENIFYKNNEYGIYLDINTNNNKIEWNDIIGNNPSLPGYSQAYDEGSDNSFSNNFWDEWVSPDTNADGIVDDPYAIDGVAINSDPNPIALPSESQSSTIPLSSSSTPATIITATTQTSSTEERGPGFSGIFVLISVLTFVFLMRVKQKIK